MPLRSWDPKNVGYLFEVTVMCSVPFCFAPLLFTLSLMESKSDIDDFKDEYNFSEASELMLSSFACFIVTIPSGANAILEITVALAKSLNRNCMTRVITGEVSSPIERQSRLRDTATLTPSERLIFLLGSSSAYAIYFMPSEWTNQMKWVAYNVCIVV